jgi:hypothetical protein
MFIPPSVLCNQNVFLSKWALVCVVVPCDSFATDGRCIVTANTAGMQNAECLATGEQNGSAADKTQAFTVLHCDFN